MEKTWLLAILSSVIVSIISFAGIFLISFKEKSLRSALVLLICFAIGALLGNTFFHLLPESYHHIHNGTTVAWLILGGFFLFFIVEHFIQTRNKKESELPQIKSYGYLSLYADAIHNFTDGVLIAVGWLASPELGVTTTLAVILHEIPQEISDFGILLRAGFSKKKALLFNFYSAAIAILGTVVTLFVGEIMNEWSIYILPIAAGGFIYLAAVNLLPELLRDSTKRNAILYFIFIFLGILLMYWFASEGGHSHAH